MRRNTKKFLAGLMATTMVVSSSMIVSADEANTDPAQGGTSGTGKLEGTVDTDVFKVVLPTIAEGDTTFNFIADPEGLIAKTSNAAYSGKSFEANKTLYFNNVAEDKTYDYASTSDKLTITNKSTMKVDVSVTATMTGLEGITLAESGTFETTDNTASIYLAITDGTSTKALSTTGAVLDATIDAAAEGAYEVVYADGTYSYALSDEAKAEGYQGFKNMNFYMTGAANGNGDWSALASMAPAVTLTWTVTEHVDNAAPAFTTGSGVGMINYTAGAGDNGLKSIESIMMTAGNGKTFDVYNAYSTAWTDATDSGSVITLSDKVVAIYADLGEADATINYINNLDEAKSATVKVKLAETTGE